jgi:pimeloyl-ACP methyl ester carboxylesterase
MTKNRGLYLLLVIFTISACKTAATEALPPVPEDIRPTATTAVPEVLEENIPPEIKESTDLDPDPALLTIPTEDGREIKATFYPAKMKSSPIIVLMHWYPGDQNEWTEIAYWLQHRGLGGELNGVPWKDPSWFPVLDPDESYNVLSFSFQGCEGNCKDYLPQLWLQDAKTALEYARTLGEVDPDQVISIGASIGGDGAIDGCAAVLEQDPAACLGALSLSPGNYLDIPYSEMVTALGENNPPRPAWCLFDQNDAESAFCSEIEEDHYYQESWSDGNLHGMHLITPFLEPQPLERILEFIRMVTGD